MGLTSVRLASRSALIATSALTALILGLGVGHEMLTSPLTTGRGVELAGVSVLGGLGFVVAGLAARRRPRRSRVGVLMLTVGFAWIIGGLRWSDGGPLLVTIGAFGGWLWAALLALLVLGFPEGRLAGRTDRVLLVVAFAVATVGRWTWLVLGDQAVMLADLPYIPDTDCSGCADAWLTTGLAVDAAVKISTAENAAAAVLALLVCVRVVWRWRRGSLLERAALTPVVGVTAAICLVVAASTGIAAFGQRDLGRALAWMWDVCIILLPFAFLGGLLRTRLRRAMDVARLVDKLASLGPNADPRGVLARELGDPGLEFVYWLPAEERYVDSRGHAIELPPPGRAVTLIESSGRPLAALCHDRSLADEHRLIGAAAGAAKLWLERTRLEAERNAGIVELRLSRTRLVEAADTERRRIERDLHDGAQQRLAALLLQARLSRRDLHDTDPEAVALLEGLERGLADAIADLRALAAGILPPVLSDHGLAAAVHELAGRCPLAVRVLAEDVGRLPPAVESAAYFMVAEALTNVLKHADAGHVTIRIERAGEAVTVQVTDDGAGGAEIAAGRGIRGLADRLAALDGTLECESPAGGGTALRAEIPCAS